MQTALTFAIVTSPTNGTITLDSDKVTYIQLLVILDRIVLLLKLMMGI